MTPSLLSSGLEDLGSVAAAVIDPAGNVLEANQGFRKVAPPTGGDAPWNAASFFLQPTFSDLLAARGDGPVVYRGLLSFGRPGDIAVSLTGTVRLSEGNLLVVAEHPVQEYERLTHAMIRLNEDLAFTQRELVREIRQRRQAEEGWRAASLYSRSLIEATLDPLVTVSEEGRILDANQAMATATGTSREALLESAFSSYFTDPAAAGEAHRDALAKGTTRDRLLAIRHTSGSFTDVLCNATVFEDMQRHRRSILTAARDVTDRLRLEREVAAQREVQFRTNRLAALGTFAKGVAHEINNPLTYVCNYLELALLSLGRDPASGEGDSTLQEARFGLERALTGAHRIGQVVGALRRVAWEPVTESRDIIDLNDVVAALVPVAERSTPPGVHLISSTATKPLYVAGNAGELQELLSALVQNAVQAVAPVGGRVTVVSREVEGRIELRVEDNGPGIPEGMEERLFAPFATTKPGATGLGLTIAHTIARLHNGDLVVERLPRGVAFVVTLPAATHAPPAKLEDEDTVSAAFGSAEEGQGAGVSKK
ncbi:MAG TPA: ATP-binding protein [Candidatus Thermoplasmatota archaeon]|nr:ATP-binding protein [Candidatus Thermoplasmatota archaeon]